jgi:hypothetical protein
MLTCFVEVRVYCLLYLDCSALFEQHAHEEFGCLRLERDLDALWEWIVYVRVSL